MKRSHCILNITCLLAIFSGNTTAVNAQDDPPANTRGKQQDSVASYGIISPQENDQRIVRWLLPDQHAIIECSKMAQERAIDERVKQFAQTMVTEHSACLDKLDGIRKQAIKSGDTDRTTTQQQNRKAGVVVTDEGQLRDNKMVYHPTDFVQVKEDICNQMKGPMAKEMKALTGSEFDRAYMKHIVVGHEALLASCKAVRKTASRDLQAMLDQNVEKLNAHLKQARQLCDQVCGTASTGKLDTSEPTKRLR